MKRIFLASALLLAAFPAQAISRYNTQTMSCDRTQQTVAREGAVILRYTSPVTGNPRYDRYVANGSFCDGSHYAQQAYVPTADTHRCVVLVCKERSDDDVFQQ
jgi:hypothetical protein